MARTPKLRRLEWIVVELEPLIEMFCDSIGFELMAREPHHALDADTALIAAGELEIFLVCPTSTGRGQPVREADPRMIQLVFDVDGEENYEDLRSRLVGSGASVADDGPRDMHLARSMMAELLGESPVLTFAMRRSDVVSQGQGRPS